MTIVAVAANPHFVVQVSDRRVTAGGAVVSEEASKSILWTLPAGRFLVAYTGIAGTTQKVDTHFLLCDLLLECAPTSNFDPQETLQKFSVELGRALARQRKYRRLNKESKRLTVMVTGLLHDDQYRPRPVQALLSNFQVWGSHDEPQAKNEFDIYWLSPRRDEDWPTLVQRIGAWNAFPIADAEAIRELLTKGKPPRAARDRMLNMLPQWAAASRGGVGLQANAVIITADRESNPQITYHTAVNTTKVYGISQVVTTPEACFAMADPEFAAIDEDARPLAVPAVDPRRPCPCASGRPYRECHGKQTS